MKMLLDSNVKRYQLILFLTLVISLGISAAHFIVPHYSQVIHGLLRRLYYIPVVLTGLLYGLRKTIFLLAFILLTYLPFIMVQWHENQIYTNLEGIYDLMIFFVVGIISATLSERERLRRRELQQAYHDTVLRLAVAAEYKDENTGEHLKRISRYSELIAENMKLQPEKIKLIKLASVMHDIGKIGIPDHILSSRAKLEDNDWKVMQSHTEMGYNILKESHSELLETAARIALAHHERFDGSGYPKGLKGDQIPLEARITSVADVFDALTTARPYKPAFSMEQALEIMTSKSGEIFDPEVLESFLRDREMIKVILETSEKPVVP